MGVFRLTDDPTRKESEKEKEKKAKNPGPVFHSTSLSVLADSATLNADGKFAFQNLSAGEYYLAVQIPGDKLKDAAALRGDNVPDRIKLASATPRRDLGVIRLASQ